jgi:16S rRNA (uracil1498-N3)-methyltransferase
VADRYFSESPISADRVVLIGPEAHHLLHVMRAKSGTRVLLFDGSGAEFNAQVESTGRNRVELAVLSRQEVDRELPQELTLGVPLPKVDRQRWLVEKAVELGVARLVPLVTARSVVQPGVAPASRRWGAKRLRQAVIGASKQCGRNRLMEIAEPRAWADYVPDAADASCRLLAQPSGKEVPPLPSGEVPKGRLGVRASTSHPGGTPISVSAGPQPRPLRWGERTVASHPSAIPPRRGLYLAVGPEGGFTDDEVSLATAAGWQTIDLGPRILRVETAALMLVAVVCQLLREPRP